MQTFFGFRAGLARLFTIFIFSVVFSTELHAQKSGLPAASLQSTQSTGSPEATLVNISNLSMWVRADGWSARNPQTGHAGVVYPRATAGVIFQDGIIWGGLVKDGREPELRAGGQQYGIGTVPGRIISRGVAEPPAAPDVRIWRIRPNWQSADLTRDAAGINDIPISDITKEHIRAVHQQYTKDWYEWPWEKGAPFYDRNGNNLLDAEEEPGLAGAHQVVWFVANDLDSTVVKSAFGSPPIGLEMQVTLWAYDQPDLLKNAIFKRIRLIYKGTASTPDTAHIDEMYIAQWSDPDLGQYFDDFVGCDSLLSLAYVYNSKIVDEHHAEFGLVPPAVGYDIVQGPLVPGEPSDKAVFDFRRFSGFKNLPMTSFAYFGAGSGFHEIGPLGSYEATVELWNLLRGFLAESDPRHPEPYRNNLTGLSTFYPLSGDPVTGTGDIDGLVLSPGDRRIFLSSGPFTMALGDTQEVVIAFLGALGSDHLQGVAELKKTSAQVQPLYNSRFQTTLPEVTLIPDYSDRQTTKISIQARAPGAIVAAAQFVDRQGEVLETVPLFDDGSHQDSLAGDSIFGNHWLTAPSKTGVLLNLLTTTSEQDTLNWSRFIQQIPTFGPVEVLELRVRSDHINSDGLINPGENIRIAARTGNASNFELDSLNIRLTSKDLWVNVRDAGQFLRQIPANDTLTLWYSPEDPNTFFEAQISPGVPPNHFIESDITLYDRHSNLWRSQATLQVLPFSVEPQTELIEHIEGPGTGTFGLYLVDPNALKAHTYRITVIDSTGLLEDRRLNLIDMTTGQTLLNYHPLPDEFSHNIPVTDGFKLTRGTLAFTHALDQYLEVAFAGEPVTPPLPVWQNANSNGSYALSRPSSPIRIDLSELQDHDLEIRFTEQGGYGWWGFGSSNTGRIPFELWDVGIGAVADASEDQRLIPVLYSNGGTPDVFDIDPGSVDEFYGLPSSDRIYFYSGDYAAFEQDAADGSLTEDYTRDEYLGRVLIVDLDEDGQLPPAGTTIRITTSKPPTKYDVYEFQPVSEYLQSNIPMRFELSPNYPNPFNSGTTIHYQMPVQGRVTLQIFNVLGQQIAQLVDEERRPGRYTVRWDGKNDAGRPVSSGLYFYRIKAERFSESRKMILLR